jgi:acyl-CoA thioesterase I
MTHPSAPIWGLVAAVLLVPASSFAEGPQTPMPLPPDNYLGSNASRPARVQLLRLSQALRATHAARILAIGSSSTVGIGASSPSRTYEARLETDLESALKGTDFEVIGHGLSGEMAQGAAARMRREVEEVKPDLVIWQVGTNDALHHVDIEGFKTCLEQTLAWLKAQQVDVILINPQYGERLIQDAYYGKVVAAIADVAKEAQIHLVDRFDAMRKLQQRNGDRYYLSADNLHMNDEGYRCLAQQLAEAIIAALPKETSDLAANHATPATR